MFLTLHTQSTRSTSTHQVVCSIFLFFFKGSLNKVHFIALEGCTNNIKRNYLPSRVSEIVGGIVLTHWVHQHLDPLSGT